MANSGYSIYKPDFERRIKRNLLPGFYPPFPNEKYQIIYCDPPWDYNGKLQFDKSAIKSENTNFSKPIFISGAAFKYPTVKTKLLKELNIESIAADDSLLFMWSTNPHLAQAIELGSAWGFEYKTVAFIWDKMTHNPGQYTLSNCELCLLFKKGRIPKPRGARNIQQLIRSPRKKHSYKPNDVRMNIEAMFPSQNKIELFARVRAKDWDSWGLDIPENENFYLYS